MAILENADDFAIAENVKSRQIPEQIESDAKPEATLDLSEEIAHDVAVFNAMLVGSLEVQLAQAPKISLAQENMTEVVARREQDQDFGASLEPFQVAVWVILNSHLEAAGQVQI